MSDLTDNQQELRELDYEQVLHAQLGVPAILTLAGRRRSAALRLWTANIPEIESAYSDTAEFFDEWRARTEVTTAAMACLAATVALLGEGGFDESIAEPEGRNREEDTALLASEVADRAAGNDRVLDGVLARLAVELVFKVDEVLGAVQLPESLTYRRS